MFTAVADLSTPYILMGVIWAVALGFAAGNYACSLVHRLPRGRLLLDKTPYCGNCGTLLKVKDLFPVVSALLLRHRCRYCGQKFPVSHTWTELLVGLLFVLAFFQYNFTEHFILVALIGVFLITLAAIEANEKLIMGKVLACVAIAGMLNRAVLDGSIFPFFMGGLYALLIGVLLTHKHTRKVGHIYVPSQPAMLCAVGGLCVGEALLLQFLALFAVFYFAGRILKLPLTVPFGFAVMLPVLYPALMTFP